jgi:ribonuclease BN (tRNA processing enzyme)
VRFHAISGNSNSPIRFETAKLRHAVTCHGYRFYAEGRVISYCTDTGLCPNMKKLAKDADLFITECAMAPGDRSPNIFHITPETAALVAAGAGVKKMALFHFDPAKYPVLDSRKEAENAARAIFKDTIAANDNATIEIR